MRFGTDVFVSAAADGKTLTRGGEEGRNKRNLLRGVGLTGCSRAGLRPAVE